EIRIGVFENAFLIEAADQGGHGHGLAEAAHVTANPFDGAAGTKNRALAGGELRFAQANRGQTGYGGGARRNAAGAAIVFEAEAVSNAVALALVKLRDHLFFRFVADRLLRPDTRVVEDADVVQPAFGGEELG